MLHDLMRRCSECYVSGTHEPQSLAYRDLDLETKRQFRNLPVAVEFTADDPYSDIDTMYRAMARGRFQVWLGGSPCAESHPLSYGDANAQFRATHDWYGHYGGHDSEHYDFSVEGELRAWLRHETQYSEECRAALFCETVLQLAYHDTFGKFVPVQKCVIAPDSLIAEVRQYAATL